MKIHSRIDVITNSSSSVFIWPNKNTEEKFKDFLRKIPKDIDNISFKKVISIKKVPQYLEDVWNMMDVSSYEAREHYDLFDMFIKKEYKNSEQDCINDYDNPVIINEKFRSFVQKKYNEGKLDDYEVYSLLDFIMVLDDGTEINIGKEIKKMFNVDNLEGFDD